MNGDAFHVSGPEPMDTGHVELAGVVREELLYAVEMVRAEHDPAVDWKAFESALWEVLAGIFDADRGEGRWRREVEMALDGNGRFRREPLDGLARRIVGG